MAENNPTPPPPPRTIILPTRTSIHNLFTGGPGASPGPMTLVSSFFAENDPDNDDQSFSQLLAGALSSPEAVSNVRLNLESGGGGSGDFRFQQNRPGDLVVSQSPEMFTIPPGLSPASLLQSPGLLSALQGPKPHQQILAQVTRQVQAQPQEQKQIQSEYTSLSAALALSVSPPQALPLEDPHTKDLSEMPLSDPKPQPLKDLSEMPLSDPKPQPLNFAVDKPADDGYNWRKYGQKQVKGSEFPRSYYKCTHLDCPVKKKVERSLDGQITEIIYKGQHNHPAPSKRSKDTGNANGTINGHVHGNSEFEGQSGNINKSKEGSWYLLSAKEQESSQVTPERVSGSSDSGEVGNAETRVSRRDEVEPESKRRHVEVQTSEQATNPRTVTEPRIVVQTTSEVDLLDDGYRWRKYGQKVVKGNPHPRSYYKCTNPGCKIRKHIERAASDPKAVITTYEGKHNHDVPTAKTSSHNTASSQLRPQAERPMANIRATESGENKQQPMALLRFKEEQHTAFL